MLVKFRLNVVVGFAFSLSISLCNILTAADLHVEQFRGNPLGWTIDGDSAASAGRNDGYATLDAAPISKRVSVEADVELSNVVGKSWKIAGVAVYNDVDNFWHFALVESPDGQQRFCELSEMRHWQWNAQNNLRVEFREQSPEPWQLGRRYRLRIALDPEGVEGSLTDAEGRVIERIRYAFSAPAVTTGRPAIGCRGFEARFSNLAVEHAEPVQTEQPEITPYQNPSYVQDVHGRATGFFRVEQQGDVWWAIDPLGRGFIPLGVDHVGYHGHWCEKVGYSPYHRKNQARYGGVEPWAVETLDRLRSWGFNLLGACCSSELLHRGLAHTEFLAFGTRMADAGDEFDIMPDKHIPCSAFPNVFHPKFDEFCRYMAERQCRPHVGDPWLFGYFLDNELRWWGDGTLNTGLFDAVMKKSTQHTAKLALRNFLAQRYENDPAKFNQAWGVELNSFDEILERDSLFGSNAEIVSADKEAFVALVAERYFDTVCKAVRAVDPNHMILGCRFAGEAADVVWAAAGRHCDIISFNYYGNVDLDQGIARDQHHPRLGKPLAEEFWKFYEAGKRPMMVTEWSFPALDAGVPSVHGAGQRFRTQVERARATEITARTMLSLPFMVGYDYFMWVDQPAQGISKIFPEDSNYGLINEDGQPYELLTAAFTRVHQDAARLRGLSQCSRSENGTVPLSEVTGFLDRFSVAPPADAIPHPSLSFQRQDNQYVATNGPWELRGQVGGASLIDQLTHRGLVVGRFNGLLQQFNRHDLWPHVGRLVEAKAVVGPQAMTIDLLGRYDAEPNNLAVSFELAYRLVLLPDADWFAVQLLSCRNVSERTMDLRAIYAQLSGTIGGSAEGDVPINQDSPPRLWGDVNGDAWLDPQAGAFLGLVAADIDPIKILFWLNDQGGQHADACWPVKRQLAPGETLRPERPTGMICLAGRGDRLQWQDQARNALTAIVGH